MAYVLDGETPLDGFLDSVKFLEPQEKKNNNRHKRFRRSHSFDPKITSLIQRQASNERTSPKPEERKQSCEKIESPLFRPSSTPSIPQSSPNLSSRHSPLTLSSRQSTATPSPKLLSPTPPLSPPSSRSEKQKLVLQKGICVSRKSQLENAIEKKEKELLKKLEEVKKLREEISSLKFSLSSLTPISSSGNSSSSSPNSYPATSASCISPSVTSPIPFASPPKEERRSSTQQPTTNNPRLNLSPFSPSSFIKSPKLPGPPRSPPSSKLMVLAQGPLSPSRGGLSRPLKPPPKYVSPSYRIEGYLDALIESVEGSTSSLISFTLGQYGGLFFVCEEKGKKDKDKDKERDKDNKERGEKGEKVEKKVVRKILGTNRVRWEWNAPCSFIVLDIEEPFHVQLHSMDFLGNANLLGTAEIKWETLLDEESHSLHLNVLTKDAKTFTVSIQAQFVRHKSSRYTAPSVASFLGDLGSPVLFIPQRLDTGDILLFDTNKMMSKVASVFTYSRWDHVAMVVINDGELMILEALMNSGVALHPLTRVATVINAGGTVAIRRLEVNRDSTFRQNLKNFLGTVIGKPYEQELSVLLRASLGKAKASAEESARLFCSQLVAAAYKALDLLPNTKVAGGYLPKDFAKRLELQNAKLDELKTFSKPPGWVLSAAAQYPTGIVTSLAATPPNGRRPKWGRTQTEKLKIKERMPEILPQIITAESDIEEQSEQQVTLWEILSDPPPSPSQTEKVSLLDFLSTDPAEFKEKISASASKELKSQSQPKKKSPRSPSKRSLKSKRSEEKGPPSGGIEKLAAFSPELPHASFVLPSSAAVSPFPTSPPFLHHPPLSPRFSPTSPYLISSPSTSLKESPLLATRSPPKYSNTALSPPPLHQDSSKIKEANDSPYHDGSPLSPLSPKVGSPPAQLISQSSPCSAQPPPLSSSLFDPSLSTPGSLFSPSLSSTTFFKPTSDNLVPPVSKKSNSISPSFSSDSPSSPPSSASTSAPVTLTFSSGASNLSFSATSVPVGEVNEKKASPSNTSWRNSSPILENFKKRCDLSPKKKKDSPKREESFVDKIASIALIRHRVSQDDEVAQGLAQKTESSEDIKPSRFRKQQKAGSQIIFREVEKRERREKRYERREEIIERGEEKLRGLATETSEGFSEMIILGLASESPESVSPLSPEQDGFVEDDGDESDEMEIMGVIPSIGEIEPFDLSMRKETLGQYGQAPEAPSEESRIFLLGHRTPTLKKKKKKKNDGNEGKRPRLKTITEKKEKVKKKEK